ncbi:MAG: hypothetical protein ACXWQO_17130 [Bdellovibrionota bacterium]
MTFKNACKISLGIALGAMAVSLNSFAAEKLLIRCDVPMPEAAPTVTYQVLAEGNKHIVVRLENEREVGRIVLNRYDAVQGYGGTYLFFENQGRSGYLLLYFHKNPTAAASDKALIDINLFQQVLHPLNSNGPRSDVSCKTITD